MSAPAGQIRDLIKKIAISDEQIGCDLVKITAVDVAKATCNGVRLQGGELQDIRLNTLAAGIVPIPKVGSVVAVGYLDPTNAVVIQYGELQSLSIDAIKIAVTASQGTVFNEGNNGGMVLVTPLIEVLNKLISLLTQCVTQHNLLVNGLATAGPLVSVAATNITPFAIPPTLIEPTTPATIANSLIKH
jgi:hypothetical protein